MNNTNGAPRPFQAVVFFLLLTYVLSWAVEITAALAAYGVLQLHVSNGLQTLAQLTPAVAALLTTGWFEGQEGIKALLASIFRARVSLRWYALVLLTPTATQAVAIVCYRGSGRAFPVLGRWYELPLATVVLALFSIGEELGWRGFFLAHLMPRNSPMAVIGGMALLWGLWHLPFYLARHASLQYLFLLGGIIPVSVFFTLIYSRTRSVFLCMLFHGSLNAGAAYWFGPLPEGDLLAFGLWTVVLWLSAIPAFVACANSAKVAHSVTEAGDRLSSAEHPTDLRST
jgi:membrane protease YdiL (CAAX protease family)